MIHIRFDLTVETWLKVFCCVTFAATHRQAEHSGGLTSAVPVRQQILRRGKNLLLCIIVYLKFILHGTKPAILSSSDHPVTGRRSSSPEQTADASPPTDRRRS